MTVEAGAVVLLLATIVNGLLAGFFYAFSHTAMPGLARRDDRTYVGAFQGVDQAVYNPWFMTTFMGGPLLVAVALVLNLDQDGTTVTLLVAALVLAVATVAITAAVHLPLNKEIQQVDLEGGGDPGPARSRFEERWVRFNLLRTLTSVGAFVIVAVVLALVD
ncbi:DUF1772 domain-containing protein [Nocardioides sp.]|uniref:anthrone oxygenase family protein n=1 Tax=Nocardioides sp. TaxID=35761 RepID=UPI002ED0776F